MIWELTGAREVQPINKPATYSPHHDHTAYMQQAYFQLPVTWKVADTCSDAHSYRHSAQLSSSHFWDVYSNESEMTLLEYVDYSGRNNHTGDSNTLYIKHKMYYDFQKNVQFYI